jgi:hypothetical protein
LGGNQKAREDFFFGKKKQKTFNSDGFDNASRFSRAAYF